jgi:opacity protein-like surface antigen
MKTRLSIFLVALLPCMAHAGGGFASLGYVLSTVEPPKATTDAEVDAIQFNFGRWFNAQRTFGVEGRAALGFGDDAMRFADGTRAEIEIDRYFGAYLRAQFPDTMPVRPYGLLGATRVETTETYGNGNTDSRNYSDISLGLGVDVTLDHNIYFTVEYLRAADRSNRQVSNLTLGVGGRF